MCEQRCFSLETVVECACHAPARLFQVQDRGYLREGYWADLVVVDPAKNTEVSKNKLFSKCQWSPFPHLTFTNSIDTTVVSGRITYHQGELKMKNGGQRVQFAQNRR